MINLALFYALVGFVTSWVVFTKIEAPPDGVVVALVFFLWPFVWAMAVLGVFGKLIWWLIPS